MLSLLRRNGLKSPYSKKDWRVAMAFARTFSDNPDVAVTELKALGFDQTWAEAVLDHFHPEAAQSEAEEDETDRGRVEAEASEPVETSATSGVERLAIEIPASYLDTVEQRAKLVAALWRRLGEGWQVESLDLQNLTAVIVRGELVCARTQPPSAWQKRRQRPTGRPRLLPTLQLVEQCWVTTPSPGGRKRLCCRPPPWSSGPAS